MTEKPLFEAVPPELDFPESERKILALWKEREIFEEALGRGADGAESFVFYEGPPTANGLPHNGHVLTRVIKDLFPRYRSMRGARVLRKGGWDTHGLPVEVEVERELRIHGKAAIEAYGVKPFIQRCIESVFRYTGEWERLTERIGFWVSLPDAYVTYHRSYVESEWWALSELFNRGLLYQGHKVVWWWAQGGTALSSGEVGLGYKTVDDPSVYLVLPLVDEPDTGLLVWTTTPWTLPSNAYAAVKPGVAYDVCEVGEPLGEKARKAPDLAVKKLILASALREAVEKKLGHRLRVVGTRSAESLSGQRYRPPFDFFYRDLGDERVALSAGGDEALFWRVIPADFVTLDTGTGIVHIAPAFGEDDHAAHRHQLLLYRDPDSVPLLSAVTPSGELSAVTGKFAGRWVKDADKDLITELSSRGLLLHHELYRHDYPFCWRSDEDPLIQLARPAWFIRTTALLKRALDNNQAVSWLPEHIKDGRFGDFLRNNVDWALSRERYWGTPLNVWICSADPEHRHAPPSVGAILEKNPKAFDHFHAARRADPGLSEHLIVHKPWIDEVVFPCPLCGAEMRRVPEVIDCWFDSGCMPFAQWGFPQEPGSLQAFDASFPADFISEAIDQTRGWFYSLLMIASLLFDEQTQRRVGLSHVREYPLPFRTCIVLGHIGDREGKKESKSKGNYTPPEVILDRVRMDFAVLGPGAGPAPKQGEALIGRDDLEGLDLNDGAEVFIYRPDAEAGALPMKLRADKKLPRRVVALSPDLLKSLGLEPAPDGLKTKVMDVPRLSAAQRLTIEDRTRPAPGADAFRWFFYAASPPSSNTRHSLTNVRTLQKDFLIKLRNVYSFFTIYANIDGYRPTDPTHQGRPVSERSLLDRWIVSELGLTVKTVSELLDRYLVYEAAHCILDFAESLSNWYVRRSRARFWVKGLPADKLDAYATLHLALSTLSRLIAPFVPFFAEELYQNLCVRAGLAAAKKSVHLDDYPTADQYPIDQELADDMRRVRQIVSLGLSVRTAEKLKVRQPLARADVVLNRGSDRLSGYLDLIREELNVQEVRLMTSQHEAGAVSFRLKPNFRTLGPKLGKDVQKAKQALERLDGAQAYAALGESGEVDLDLGDRTITLGPDDLEIAVEAAPGFAAETGKVGVVVLHTTLTDELLDQGLLREVQSRVQAARKERSLDFTDRVRLRIRGSTRVMRVVRAGKAEIASECLVSELVCEDVAPGAGAIEIGEERLELFIDQVES